VAKRHRHPAADPSSKFESRPLAMGGFFVFRFLIFILKLFYEYSTGFF
jgi:hypothetical protein